MPYALALAGVVGCSGLLWASLRPREPNLPGYQRLQEQQAAYQPGGSGCDPSRLARLPVPARETAAERDRCAEAAEDYRLKANDLVQQTRSAEAGEAVAVLTYAQSRMALAGLILSFATLVAAVAAAVCARRAAIETERGAGAAKDAVAAAVEANRLSHEAFVADRRPWVAPDVRIGGPLTWAPRGGTFFCEVSLRNSGSAPAFDVSIHMEATARVSDEQLIQAQQRLADKVRAEGPYQGTVIFPGGEHRDRIDLLLNKADVDKGSEDRKSIDPHRDWIQLFVFGVIDYQDRIGGTGSAHQTGFIVRVVRRVPTYNLWEIGPSLGDVPADELGVMPWRHGGCVD